MSLGLDSILALSAPRLLSLRVHVRHSLGVREGVLKPRQCNVDAECSGLLRITNREVMGTGYEACLSYKVNGHERWNGDESFVDLL